MCFSGLGNLERKAGRLEQAYRYDSQSLAVFMQMGDKERSFWVHQSLGEMAEALSLVEEARSHFEANLKYLSELGNQEGQENYHQRLAQLDQRKA